MKMNEMVLEEFLYSDKLTEFEKMKDEESMQSLLGKRFTQLKRITGSLHKFI